MSIERGGYGYVDIFSSAGILAKRTEAFMGLLKVEGVAHGSMPGPVKREVYRTAANHLS